ncbi:MAG TPA: protein-methionine-sulfoxide reductase heme-binding subunit MsrQ [Terriglobia bacterium]|nr:protein-methionine-sulfoxide reductase heme-binding subunit MsrQ [Terriglobia bacterium]
MREWIYARATDSRFYLFLTCTLPAALLVRAIATGNLGANPLETIRDTTGIWTLRFLLVTLAITPVRRLTGWHKIIQARRVIGLCAFFYAVLHFVSYVWLDQFFALDGMIDDLTKRPFIMAGYASFVVLIPLAVTSTKKWIWRLGGRKWRLLHRLIYFSAAAGVVHYFWRVKLDVQSPVIYAVLLGTLLLARLPRSILERKRAAAEAQILQAKSSRWR